MSGTIKIKNPANPKHEIFEVENPKYQTWDEIWAQYGKGRGWWLIITNYVHPNVGGIVRYYSDAQTEEFWEVYKAASEKFDDKDGDILLPICIGEYGRGIWWSLST